MPSLIRFLPLTFLLAALGARAEPLVTHDLEVLIDPERGTLAAVDRVTLPTGKGPWTFVLHQGLDPRISGGEGRLERMAASDHLERFRLERTGDGPVTLRYAGPIRHGLEEVREGMGRARQQSRGTISPEGVVLDGYSGWYPRFDGTLQAFELDVRLPAGWTAVSQGAGPEIAPESTHVRIGWRETHPQDDVHLIAAPFERYARPTPFGEAQVYLRRPDPELAERYLAATERYLGLYSDLIGPYPYAKFALVENFWDTGYGMPSFTLLGPRVIRLPFILHTSYPHEVLHNWWGNGVYVDYATGNWSEGLTAYLADHLLAEERGTGADYRRDALKSYADYVRADGDFPLRDFRGRHGSASQAVGYGKTLMVLHMLRRELGDETFVAGIRRFWRDNRFRTAGFDDLRRAFEAVSGRDLGDWFGAWIERPGAPEIRLEEVTRTPTPEGWRLTGRLAQVQEEAPFPLTVPLVVYLEGGGLHEARVPLTGRSGPFALDLPARPLRLDADPRFDLFRHLAPGETPATLSALFGAERGLIVTPTDAPPALQEAWEALAAAWARSSRGWEVTEDTNLDALPADRPVWLLGWDNRFLPVLGEASPALDAAERRVSLEGETLAGPQWSAALVGEHGGQPLGLVAAGDPAAVPGLARKLPHYGKYSYLGFAGQAPDNRIKGQWPAGTSAMSVWLGDERPDLVVPEAMPLTAVLAP
jgi:aminopeptidase N